MKIKVLYFASLREKLGKSEDEIEVEDNFTLSDFIKKLSEDGKIKEVLFGSNELKKEITVAHNAVTVKREDFNKIKLKNDDTIAFFPVVSAG
ncbi:MAG: MoaD/ThiS family protein [Thermoproteota archaeon]